MYKVFFGHHTIFLTGRNDLEKGVMSEMQFDLGRYPVRDLLMQLKADRSPARIGFTEADAAKALSRFSAEFKLIRAAGGVVMSPQGNMLWIHRKGKWDLPKGKVGRSESLEDGAVREVVEETGVADLKLMHALDFGCLGLQNAGTLHCYAEKGKDYLKQTHWFEMRVEKEQQPVPEKGEDIERAVWADQEQIRFLLQDAYPSIRDVYAAAIYGADE